ncbi:hypothetical protein FKL64_24890 [Escherichia coli]|nr:hypothetical protein [Escherichia coli]
MATGRAAIEDAVDDDVSEIVGIALVSAFEILPESNTEQHFLDPLNQRLVPLPIATEIALGVEEWHQ